MGLLSEVFSECLKPIDRSPPWQWAEKYVNVDRNSPFPGNWRLANSPFVKELMEVFPDNGVKNIAVMTSAQSSKTLTIMTLLEWAIANDPGPAMWVQAAQDEAATFVRNRLQPMFEDCEPVARLLMSNQEGEKSRHEVKLTEVGFKTMSLWITGSKSSSKLKSKPIRWLFLDEVSEYPPGALDSVTKRIRSFWNSRRVTISTPKMWRDAMHVAYLEGDQREWHFRCPHCEHEQMLVLSQLKAANPDTGLGCRWDEVPGAVSNEVWNFDVLAKQIRYECKACGHLMEDEPKTRQHIASVGRWIPQNPKASSRNVSFHWNAMLPPIVHWRDIVEEKIMADRALRLGNVEPLMEFINQTLGEPWEDRLKEFDDFGVLERRKDDYPLAVKQEDGRMTVDWPDFEIGRLFLAFDVQESPFYHYRYVCRAFSKDKRTSRLVSYGKIGAEEEAEALRIALGVATKDTVIDAAHDASRVYKACLKYKWKAFRGDDRSEFSAAVQDPKDPNKTITARRCWALSHADPAIGTPMQGKVRPIKLYLWSNPMVKDILALAWTGIEQDWTFSTMVGQDYLRELTAEVREEETDSRGRVSYVWNKKRKDDHYRDCELMVMTSAIISGAVQREAEEPADEGTEPDVK